MGGGSQPGVVSVRETPCTVTCEQYASYWKAFLQKIGLLIIKV